MRFYNWGVIKVGFWLFMLIMVLITPLTMIMFGWLFMKYPPRTINHIYGYRTAMSMKNKDTWNFAHKHCGKIWYYVGIIMLPLSVIFMLFFIDKETSTVGTFGAALIIIQTLILIASTFPTTVALHKHFDKDGMRKN
jgi:uncharacterized membrane protein